MVRSAKHKVGLDPEGRIAFRVADAADLPYEDESFDLITHLNMPPFIAEVERVLRPAARSSWPPTGEAPSLPPKGRWLGVRKAGIESDAAGEARVGTYWVAAAPRMSTDDRHLVLVNPSAGGGHPTCCPSSRPLHELTYRLVMTTSLDHGVREARAAAADGEIPVVMSGDGLIGQVGGSLVGTEAPLGVIPGGRGNDFARVVGIPTAIPDAVELIAADHRRSIDVGEVNGHRFLCIELRIRFRRQPIANGPAW
jgi:hypothetical protein